MTTKTELLKAVRARCLDCCCYQSGEVRLCTATGCALWTYRLGIDPTPSRRSAAKNFVPAERNLGEETGKAASGTASTADATQRPPA